jgi:hypothetical protein
VVGNVDLDALIGMVSLADRVGDVSFRADLPDVALPCGHLDRRGRPPR